jgi:hypothetical protein
MKHRLLSLSAIALCTAAAAPVARAAVVFNTNGATIGAVNDSVLVGNAPVSPPITVFANAGTSVTGGLRVFNDSTLQMSGGSVASLTSLFNTSTFNFSGGTLGLVQPQDSSTFNISGGLVTSTTAAFHTSTINITGGTLQAVAAQNSSTLNISGGLVTNALGFHTSTINITGGTFSAAILAQGNSTVNIHGGNIFSGLIGTENGVFNIYGTNLQATFLDTVGGRNNYVLSGFLEDGTPLAGRTISLDIGSNATLQLVPAPGAAMLLGLSAAGMLTRRRRQR